MSDDLTAKIIADYPSFAYLLNDPDIGPLLLEAVDPNIGFDAQTFQAKLMQTNWWKTHSPAQRQWETLYNTDRAAADSQLSARYAEVRNYAASLGLEVPEQKLWDVTELSLHNGLSVDSAQIRGMLAWFSPQGAPAAKPDLRSIAQRDYMVPLPEGDIGWWSREIAAGHQTEQTFRAKLVADAAGRYTGFADRILAGETPGVIFGAYKQSIANELEYGSADQVDLLNDPRWAQVTGTRGADDKIRPMTLAETQQLARSQEEWKNTSKGKALSAQLVDTLTHTFGER